MHSGKADDAAAAGEGSESDGGVAFVLGIRNKSKHLVASLARSAQQTVEDAITTRRLSVATSELSTDDASAAAAKASGRIHTPL